MDIRGSQLKPKKKASKAGRMLTITFKTKIDKDNFDNLLENVYHKLNRKKTDGVESIIMTKALEHYYSGLKSGEIERF